MQLIYYYLHMIGWTRGTLTYCQQITARQIHLQNKDHQIILNRLFHQIKRINL